MSAPRLGRAVRLFTPVVLAGSLAVPMMAPAASPSTATVQSQDQGQGQGQDQGQGHGQGQGQDQGQGWAHAGNGNDDHGGNSNHDHGNSNHDHGNSNHDDHGNSNNYDHGNNNDDHGKGDDHGHDDKPGKSGDKSPAPASAAASVAALGQSLSTAVTQVTTSRSCTSKRAVTIRLDGGYRVRAARVLLDGKLVGVKRHGKRLTATIDLRNRAKGTYTVHTVVVTEGNKIRVTRRTFQTCTAKRLTARPH
jgi:hypothetical protein